MKKTILFLAAVLFVSTANAQLFVKAGVGYNFSALAAPQIADNLDSNGAIVSTIVDRHSFGNGLQALGAIGYDFNENLGFQLGFGYALSSAEYNSITDRNAIVKHDRTLQANGAMVLMPALTLSSNADRLNLYSRVGLTLPIGGEIEETNHFYGTNGYDLKSTRIIKGKMSVGFNAALGTSVPLGDNLGLWLELNGNFLNVAGSTRTLTSYVENGVDELANQTFQTVNWEYVDEVAVGANSDVTKSNKVPTVDAPFSSIGAAVGIKLSLGNGREKRQDDK